ncbi:aminotransferase class IV [Pseudoclavibacter terrae]|uniref:Aminotransferase class IV n=2 Tax=Pseudoclavibacter terrae TaxID=1530195 RepID=A0A7J5AZW0_9MICO|nr:aminotransferase class IV [Pseudoclavibacter terrae]
MGTLMRAFSVTLVTTRFPGSPHGSGRRRGRQNTPEATTSAPSPGPRLRSAAPLLGQNGAMQGHGAAEAGEGAARDDSGAAGREASVVSVVESWRVDSGRVIAHAAHRERFERSVGELFGDAATAHPLLWSGSPAGTNTVDADWRRIWADVFESVPLADSWFPRLSAHLAGEGEAGGDRVLVELALRPAPEARPLTKLVTRLDERRWPTVKGPDFPYLSEVRASAAEQGAADALLVDDRGVITEAAHGTVVGWRGETLVIPDGRRRVPGTTLGVLDKLLAMAGVPRVEGELRADPLAASADRGWDELWYLNTLHGISPVSMLDGTRLGLDVARVRRWRPRLEETSAVPLLDGRPSDGRGA